jgi:UDP-N-acetyl-D-glucosamine dehydrogenase
MNVVVVALGKIGLPLAVHIAHAGHIVVGCDTNAAVVDLANSGQPPFPGEEQLGERLSELAFSGRFRANVDTTTAVAEHPELVIAVPPLIIDQEGIADYAAVDAVTAAIGKGLRAGTTVVFETTLPVGTTRDRILPRLESESGLRADEDFFLAFSPERVSSGRVFRDLDTYPKLVGGIGRESEERAVALYRQFISCDVWPMGSSEAAELTKLAETTYRSINIAFANELARYADVSGIDVFEVIAAANSQPYSHLHQPGVAVGGHCIPVYPYLYLQGDRDARLPRVGLDINEAMPAYAVERVAAEMGGLGGRRVLILGVAYRGGVKEAAFSGAFGVRDAILAADGIPLAADPLYTDTELTDLGFAPWDGEDVDGALLQADHPEYARLSPQDVGNAPVVLDGRNRLDPSRLLSANIRVVRLGRPAQPERAAVSAGAIQ